MADGSADNRHVGGKRQNIAVRSAARVLKGCDLRDGPSRANPFLVSAPATAALQQVELNQPPPPAPRSIDFWMLAGIAIAIGAVLAGVASAGIRIGYFFQPTGMLIVMGGTLGVTFITTPRLALYRATRAMIALLWTPAVNREALMEEIVRLSRIIRPKGLSAIEPLIGKLDQPFLRESLQFAVDALSRSELQTMLETKLRQLEKQGETDARAFEVAGGFAPTIGVLGTVVGLMDVLRQFSNIASVAAGTGTAFVSTIYGLGLANLILLPSAQRIRSHVAEQFETNEMIVEGTLCLFDGVHPALVRDRLSCFLRREEQRG
jgi:chemotaxis protein MotA